MSLFERPMFANTGDDAGVFMEDLARALQTWAAMNYGKKHTVAEAAEAFNTSAAVIREAVDEGYWMIWHGPDDDPTKQVIELDGD